MEPIIAFNLFESLSMMTAARAHLDEPPSGASPRPLDDALRGAGRALDRGGDGDRSGARLRPRHAVAKEALNSGLSVREILCATATLA